MARNFSGKRMVKNWRSFNTTITQSIAADVTGVVAGNVGLDELFTVLRILGSWHYGPGGVNVVNDAAAISVGIGLVSSDAAALGGTAMPDPEDESDYPWLYFKTVQFVQTIAQQHSDGDPRMAGRFEIDVKSMRKVKPRESLVTVFQYRNINGNPTVDLSFPRARVLIAR